MPRIEAGITKMIFNVFFAIAQGVALLLLSWNLRMSVQVPVLMERVGNYRDENAKEHVALSKSLDNVVTRVEYERDIADIKVRIANIELKIRNIEKNGN